MSDMFNTLVSLLGIVLGFAGVALTFITFFAPGIIQKLALRNPERWVSVPAQTEESKAYRHSVLSGFMINVDLSEPVTEDFFEYWMNALYRPDPRASSYYVTLFFNGLPMDRMLFLQYDGGRNFIPVPTLRRHGDRIYVEFSREQGQFANVVGFDYFGRSFREVALSIVESQYNPQFLSLSDHELPERLRSLHEKIEEYKKRASNS